MKKNQVLPNKINMFLHQDYNVVTLDKVLFTIKTLELAVGCFEIMYIYPTCKHNNEFEDNVKATCETVYGTIDIDTEVFFTEVEDTELLDKNFSPSSFSLTIN